MVLLTFSGVYLFHFVAMMEEVSLMIDSVKIQYESILVLLFR